MSFVGDLVGDVFGGITGAKQAGKAAERAAETQVGAAQAGIEEQRRQFDRMIELTSPYVSAGVGALGGQQALLGLSGGPAQQAAIDALRASPQFQSMLEQGETSILQNAAATGGLRGGNVQAALGQFSPQLLSQLINQQYSQLGGLSQMGQAAAAGQASGGMQSAGNIANLLAQQGAATAGGQIAGGAVPSQAFGTLARIGGLAAGLGAFGGTGGGPQVGGAAGAYGAPTSFGVAPGGNFGSLGSGFYGLNTGGF